MIARGADLVRAIAEAERRLGRDQHVLTVQMVDGPTQHALAVSVGVDVSRVKEVDAGIHTDIDDLLRLGHVRRSPCLEELILMSAECSTSEAKLRHLQTRSAKLSILHDHSMRMQYVRG